MAGMSGFNGFEVKSYENLVDIQRNLAGLPVLHCTSGILYVL